MSARKHGLVRYDDKCCPAVAFVTTVSLHEQRGGKQSGDAQGDAWRGRRGAGGGGHCGTGGVDHRKGGKVGKEKLAGAELSSRDVDELGHAAASGIRFVVVLVVDGVHRQIADSSIAVGHVA